MKTIVFVITIFVLFVTGCSTVVPYEGDPISASVANADLGAKYLETGDLKKARTKLEKALATNDENAKANFYYAILLSKVNQPELANPYFLKATKLAPEETHYNETFGVFLCRLGDYKEANEQFTKSASNPFNQTVEYAYNNAGSCAMSLGRIEDAEDNIRKALRANPRFTPALLNMVEVLLEQDKYEIADAYYLRYLKYGEHNADSLWLGIQLKRYLGDRIAMDQYGLRLKSDYPQSRETLLYLESKQL
jgi:type IV pilus assembly protein PilF